MASPVIHFLKEHIPALLSRYAFLYYREDNCIEYFIKKKGENQSISQSIVFSFNQRSRQIYVSKFYPELYKQTRCKYLSAACFYLLANHFANIFMLPDDCPICLETKPETYRNFYSKLQGFGFHIEWIE